MCDPRARRSCQVQPTVPFFSQEVLREEVPRREETRKENLLKEKCNVNDSITSPDFESTGFVVLYSYSLRPPLSRTRIGAGDNKIFAIVTALPASPLPRHQTREQGSERVAPSAGQNSSLGNSRNNFKNFIRTLRR